MSQLFSDSNVLVKENYDSNGLFWIVGNIGDNETCVRPVGFSFSRRKERSDVPKKVGGSQAIRPGARLSKVPVTFRGRNKIFKSKYKE